MRKVGSRHAYLEKMAFAEEAKLNEIPIGSKHAYLEDWKSLPMHWRSS
jgi:hypothetical protein